MRWIAPSMWSTIWRIIGGTSRSGSPAMSNSVSVVSSGTVVRASVRCANAPPSQ